MEVITKLVDAGKNLFSYLSWGRIAMIAVLIALALATTAFWDNRPVIYKAISANKFGGDSTIPELSEPTKVSIATVVDRHPNIVALQVVETIWRTNVRNTTYFYSDEAELTSDYSKMAKTKVSDTPIFVTGDKDGNDRLIAIIDQEFVCVAMPARLNELYPSANKNSKQVCSISVPPRYGMMVGYINVWLKEPIDRSQLPVYKHIARNLSDEIYNRDVLKVIK